LIDLITGRTTLILQIPGRRAFEAITNGMDIDPITGRLVLSLFDRLTVLTISGGSQTARDSARLQYEDDDSVVRVSFLASSLTSLLVPLSSLFSLTNTSPLFSLPLCRILANPTLWLLPMLQFLEASPFSMQSTQPTQSCLSSKSLQVT
jgi:hypothetical protein